MLLYNSIKKSVRLHESNPAIKCNDQIITYAELLMQIERAISYLQKNGVKSGDRIAVCIRQSPALIYLYFAASRLGVTLVFLGDALDLTIHELQNLLDGARPDWLLLDAQVISWQKIQFNRQCLLLIDELDQQSVLRNDLSEFSQSNLLGSFLHIYTSSATEKSRGVCLTEIALYIQARQLAQKMQIDTHSQVLLTGSIFNTTELSLATTALIQGATLYFELGTRAQTLIDTVEEKQISHFILQANDVLSILRDKKNFTRHHLTCLKVIAYHAATISQNMLEQVRQILPCAWLQAYGLTETCGPVVWLEETDHKYKKESAGLSAGETEINIIGEDGKQATQYEIGEIVLKGPTIMLGYWNPVTLQPDRTALSHGWFSTGDLGYLDEDGYLFLCGRKKDCIVTANGFTIYPREIEEVLQQFGSIDESTVVGSKFENETGECPVAFIKSSQFCDLAQLKNFLMQRISTLKFPRYVVSVKQPLPRKQNGKINKRELQEQVAFLARTNQLVQF